MAKSNKNNPISLELDRYEKKIKQYQDYLDKFNILLIADESERHKEIACQNSIMDKLANWLKGLRELREEAQSKGVETRGDVEIPAAWKHLTTNQ